MGDSFGCYAQQSSQLVAWRNQIDKGLQTGDVERSLKALTARSRSAMPLNYSDHLSWRFSQETCRYAMAQNPFYVYALKDPRHKPAKPFYIGKGTGNRAWEHQSQIDDSEKGQQISAIQNAGLTVLHTILADDLTEAQALKIEAELISAFGVRSQGGLLTNKVRPNPDHTARHLRLNVPDGCYEKAQLALELLKSAVMELAKANPGGITNGDVAKYLGLQSDYGGGSKDYLSYSLLGLLMKEGRIQRLSNRKHVASGE